MRRTRVIALVGVAAVLLAGALWWAAGPDAGGGPGPEGPASPVGGAPAALPAAGPRGLSSALSRRFVAQTGTLVGRVVGPNADGVEGASLLVQGPTRRYETSGPDGAFRLEGLAPGEYVLNAAKGTRASAPLGPVPVGPGEELRDLTLVLEAGAALSGVVRDSADSRPVPGASVAAGASSATADAQGRFLLTGLPAGPLTLFAAAEGYVPRSSEVEVARGQERTGAEVFLERAARVFGRVTMQAGQPIAGAQVLASRYGFAAREAALAPVAVTGDDGTFSGNVPPGRLQLVARAAGFAEGRTDEFEVAAGAERETNLTLGAGGAIYGQVRDAQGAGAPGCRVDAFDTVHGRVTAQTTSGPGGQYWLSGVPQAVYVVAATCEAGRAEVPGLRVAEGAQVQADLLLGTGVIAGRVVDSAGEPVAGATLSVRGDGSAAPEAAAGVSRTNGAFELRGLAGTRFALTATAPQGRAERSGVSPGTRDLVLVLGSGELVGSVVGSRGEPVTDFVVYAEPAGLGSGRPRSQHFISPTGEFRMALAPGRYGLRVGATGYTSALVANVEVSAGPGSPVRVTLTKGAVLRGRTLDPEGKPVPGVRLATHPNMLYAFGRAAPVGAGAFATSDEQGSFVLNGVAPSERVHVFAAKEGWEQRGPAFTSVASGAEASVEVRLFPNSRPEPEREFAGVGMTLSIRGQTVAVLEVFEGGPAREAGIRPGDQVTHVEGAPTAGLPLDQVVGRIRGEVGTTVTLTIRRDGRDTVLSIPRAVVKF